MKFYVQFRQADQFRDAKGLYVKATGKVTGAYGDFAKELQSEVAQIIKSERSVREKNPWMVERGRPPKGNLARVTLNVKNRNITPVGFEVGIESYLERSEAKYYRIIEEGTAEAAPQYTETMISGWWRGASPTGYIKPHPPDKIEHGLPRKGIKPLYAYRRAWDNVGGNQRMLRIWTQMLRDAGMAASRGPLRKNVRVEGDLKFGAPY